MKREQLSEQIVPVAWLEKGDFFFLLDLTGEPDKSERWEYRYHHTSNASRKHERFLGGPIVEYKWFDPWVLVYFEEKKPPAKSKKQPTQAEGQGQEKGDEDE